MYENPHIHARVRDPTYMTGSKTEWKKGCIKHLNGRNSWTPEFIFVFCTRSGLGLRAPAQRT